MFCAGLYIVVTMQAQKEVPPDMQSKDKFLIQSVLAPYGATAKDIAPEIVSIFVFLVICSNRACVKFIFIYGLLFGWLHVV